MSPLEKRQLPNCSDMGQEQVIVSIVECNYDIHS